jgi:DNA processing protein
VLVTEARFGSGALITARLALEYDREVMAVPGSIYSASSQGTNSLLAEGARLVSSTSDIFDELNLPRLNSQAQLLQVKPSSQPEAAIIRLLSKGPSHIDEIVRSTGMATSTVSSTLAMMEIKGWVLQVEPMTYTATTMIKNN